MDLKQYRKSLGLTQQQMGEALGVSKARMGQIEKSWPNIAVSTILDLVKIYDAKIIIDTPGGARFVEERPADNRTQEDLIRDLDYLPDAD